jgi:glycosyltransferase involved in cell wall biosynthesis
MENTPDGAGKNPKMIIIVGLPRDREELVKPLASISEEIVVVDFTDSRRLKVSKCLPELARTLRREKGTPKRVIGSFSLKTELLLRFLKMFFELYSTIQLRGDYLTETRDEISSLVKRGAYLNAIPARIRYSCGLWILRTADQVIAVSRHLKVSHPFSRNWKVIPIPCDESRFGKKADYILTEGRRIRVLAVTGFRYPRKIEGLHEFIENYHPFLSAHNIELDIAGDGFYLEESRRRFSDKGNVNFLGCIEDIRNLYRQYDLFVHFSYLDGYPNAVLEAQASRVPVVVNDACGMAEQIEDGENGFVVDLKNGKETERKFLALIESEELRRRFGENGLKSVRENNCYREIGTRLRSALLSSRRKKNSS